MSNEQDFQEINKRIGKLSKEYEVFSNPIRTLIISIVLVKNEVNWTQLKEIIEKITGNNINPNTLSFHIGKLIEMEFIEKVGTREQPIYRIMENNLQKILGNIDPLVTETLKKAI